MTLLRAHRKAMDRGLRTVLATVVRVEGSSYRNVGVRMLVIEDGQRIGAVSGGCVEDEVARQAVLVLEDGHARMVLYDGRLRQGCDGVLHVLLEVFEPDEQCITALDELFAMRSSITLQATYHPQEGAHAGMGTRLVLGGRSFGFGPGVVNEDLPRFEEVLQPLLRLLIFGGEHDAAALCALASQLGWQVTVFRSAKDRRTAHGFPGATEMLWPDGPLDLSMADDRTMAMVMTHNYARDLKCLHQLAEMALPFVGLLGPVARRERLFTDLMDRKPGLAMDFLESVHGPAGLDLGAITPEEIALSILAELLAFDRKRNACPLRELGMVRHMDQPT